MSMMCTYMSRTQTLINGVRLWKSRFANIDERHTRLVTTVPSARDTTSDDNDDERSELSYVVFDLNDKNGGHRLSLLGHLSPPPEVSR